MKRKISFIFSMLLCLSMLFGMTSCSIGELGKKNEKNHIEKFFEKMGEQENAQITMSIFEIPQVGNITMKIKIDGNIQYMEETLFNEEQYIETVGDIEYIYTRDTNGKWTINKSDEEADDENDISTEDFVELFNPSNYEKVKDEEKTYRQKKDVVFDLFDDAIIYAGEKALTITFQYAIEGILYDAKITISKVGEVDLTLPELGKA